jgi:hypothetical protein
MEEEKGFNVRDRRIDHDGGAAEAAPAEAAAERPAEQAAPAPEATSNAQQPPEAAADAAAGVTDTDAAERGFSMGPEMPPIDFSAFVLSLARTALIHLGLESHPETGGQTANLEAARETIDVLGMLEEKTRGNLTPDESELISKMLYTLRMSYVEVARAHGAG